MSSGTPRRSLRTPIVHTPKMSERKKGLFQPEVIKDSLTKHRRMPVLDSESDGDDCDLGIISALDGSSGDEMTDDKTKTPERKFWYETRSHTSRLLNENHNLKNFIKSPFTLKKYQSLCVTEPKGYVSTPVTPHMHTHPGTPSSTHSCASAHTTLSEHSRARRNLAGLIADTESCSSSLKDLNFNTDSSGTDSKENTPTKSLRKSSRTKKMTPKFASFKGILQEQKSNTTSPCYFTKTEDSNEGVMSPTEMLKTPHNPTDAALSPPKIRRSVVEIAESPELSCESEVSHKRLRNDSISLDSAPNSKYLKLDPAVAPKARLSLFGSDKLKEILSVKSFYGKSSSELKPKEHENMRYKLENVVRGSSSHPRRPIVHHQQRRQRGRKTGQINFGVHHRIRKPKVHNKGNVVKLTGSQGAKPITVNVSTFAVSSPNLSFGKNTSQTENGSFSHADKQDPFTSEKQTVANLLSQWNEEEVPEKEMAYTKPKSDLACFSKSAMESNPILPPVSAVPVEGCAVEMGEGSVIMELGAQSDGEYIVVDSEVQNVNENVPDLDEIERELQRLDAEILKMAASNNINVTAAIASTETTSIDMVACKTEEVSNEDSAKLFPIFNNPDPGLDKPAKSKGNTEKTIKKSTIKSSNNQYIIDAGQKKFGATQCTECGVIYEIGDPQDEYDHLMYHNATDILKFNGHKDEQIAGTWESDRCIRIRGGTSAWRRVYALLSRLVHPQLGYEADLPKSPQHYTAYLYIEKKKIVGCLVVEPKAQAHRFIPGDPDCYSDELYPVVMGVSRIWTHVSSRGRGIASRMLNAARATFLLGHVLNTHQIAFSAPTAQGKALATRYCNTTQFYVYVR